MFRVQGTSQASGGWRPGFWVWGCFEEKVCLGLLTTKKVVWLELLGGCGQWSHLYWGQQ